MAQNWWIGSDNMLEVDGLTNNLTGAYINDATVSCQMKTDAGANEGSSFSLSYVAASNGTYRGVFTDTDAADLTDGATYYCEITITGDTYKLIIRVKYIARYKDEDD